ncbi:MAG: YihY/virulence factor BrkB family protein [Vulcanimicrobiaceae bacterium]
MRTPAALWRVFRSAAKGWGKHNGTRIAASLAFFSVFSLAPILILIVAAVGLFFGMTHIKGEIQGQVALLIGHRGSGIVGTLMDAYARHGSDRFTLTVAGVLVIVYVVGLFIQVQNALDDIWEIPPHVKGGFLKVVVFRAHALLALLALAIIALGAFGSIELIPELGHAGMAVNVAALAVFLTVIYRVLPQVEIRWSSAAIGGVITTITLVLGEAALSLYFRNLHPGAPFGALESFVVVLLWLHYSAVLLVFGAELTRAFEMDHPSTWT